ncbi:MAG: repeat protein [Candidatus Solibacter sp.]|nr:repeat protein [Candidatus Solibacter sp.]
MKTLTVLLAAAGILLAGQTRTWTQSDSADFEKGILKNLSLRSDGRLSLAPVSRELFDTSSAYLWALAQDSKGVLYAGGGTSAKLYRIPPDGKGKVLADLDALEIHAIAIDSRDRVYAATSPDGKVYRITGNGKPEVFYDPKAKYIWSLAFDSAGNLFVATGDQGEIHRVTPDGKGKVFFKTEETHVRSMVIDSKGNLIAGTEPGGLVLRVSPAGDGFVVYQMAKKEVTAVAVAPDGAIYAAAVGNRQSGPPPAPTPSPAPAQVQVNSQGGAAAPRQPNPPPTASVAPAGVAGGTEVYRIDPDGVPRRVWTHAQDVIYAIAFDATGRALLGAGNKGNLYRIESPTLSTALLVMPSTQVTALRMTGGGHLYAATGNAGKVYEIGPAIEATGSVESDVFDSSNYSMWGRVSLEGSLNGGQISLATRSGNLDQPQKNWSPWAPVGAGLKGGRSASPAARFVQWKATFAAASGTSPELDSVDVAYLPKNLEPRVDEIEATPPNYKFPTSSISSLLIVQSTLSLPPIGKHATTSGGPPMTLDTTPAMQYAKGFTGARWSAQDPNGDPLIFTVEIRGVKETEWKLLKDKVSEKYLTWDSTAFPDGEYRIRVTASDAPGNPPAEALTARLESGAFWIDNTPPKVTGLSATRNGAQLIVKWHAADALNDIGKAEYSLDGGEWKVAAPVTRLSDAQELDYELALDAPPGEHTIAVRMEDDYGNQVVEKVVVR